MPAAEPSQSGRDGGIGPSKPSRGRGSGADGSKTGGGSGGSRSGGSKGGGRSGGSRSGGSKGGGRSGGSKGEGRSGGSRSGGSKGGGRSRGSKGDGRSGGSRSGASGTEPDIEEGRRDWGALARRGARNVSDDRRGWPATPEPLAGPPAPSDEDQWVRVGGEPTPPASGRSRRVKRDKADVTVDVAQLAGLRPAQRKRFVDRLAEGAADYEAERYGDARSTLGPLVKRHPDVAELRELHGLVLYRLGRWNEAEAELSRFSEMTGGTEQHPVRMDCARAAGRSDELERLWEELREASPSADLVTEGRIVAAAAAADDGRVDVAIRLLEAGPVRTRYPRPHHLRLWYALADMYERSGDVPRARRGFERLAGVDPDFADVGDRLRTLT